MADIILITALLIAVFFVVRTQLRRLSRGQCPDCCGGNCAACHREEGKETVKETVKEMP